MAAARLGMSTDSKDVPQTAQGGESITAQTSSSVLEDTKKAVTGRMPLTSERLVSSKHLKGRMSAAKITRMVEAISKTRKELSEKKAREVFEREYELKREDLQSRPDEAARQLWDYGRTRQGAEERIAGTEALVKSLKRKLLLPAGTSARPMINIIGSVRNGEQRSQSRGGNSARHFTRTGCENRSSCPTFPRRYLRLKTRSWLSPSDRQHLRLPMRKPREKRCQLGWAPHRSVARLRKLAGHLRHGAYWRSSWTSLKLSGDGNFFL